jgi:hypothetical protein
VDSSGVLWLLPIVLLQSQRSNMFLHILKSKQEIGQPAAQWNRGLEDGGSSFGFIYTKDPSVVAIVSDRSGHLLGVSTGSRPGDAVVQVASSDAAHLSPSNLWRIQPTAADGRLVHLVNCSTGLAMDATVSTERRGLRDPVVQLSQSEAAPWLLTGVTPHRARDRAGLLAGSSFSFEFMSPTMVRVRHNNAHWADVNVQVTERGVIETKCVPPSPTASGLPIPAPERIVFNHWSAALEHGGRGGGGGRGEGVRA